MAFSMNPMQLIQMIKSGGASNPQQLVINMLEQQAGNNPAMKNMLNMAKQGNSKGVEQIARNILKEQGKDFDKEFTNFRQTMGL